jgi:O-antigen ligase
MAALQGAGSLQGMHLALAALFVFGILTLWVPAWWPVTVFQVAAFAFAGIALYRVPLRNGRGSETLFTWPLLPLCFAVLWGLFQLLSGRTFYGFATKTAILHWATLLAVFLTGVIIFREEPLRRWFRSAMLWFSFVVAAVATLQTFTFGGKIFWIFPTEYSGFVMGPIIYHTHFAAFVEIVLPIALYKALRHRRGSLLYSVVTAVLFASVIASASRAGTVLCSAEILVVSALLWSRSGATRGALGLLLLRMAVLFLVFTAIVGWETVWVRFWAPDPMAVRREFDISSLHMIAARPWCGFGLGTWPTAYPRYAIIDIGVFANQAHSDWLQWTAEGGLPFAIALLSLFVWCLRPAFRSVWGLGVIAVFLHAAVDYPFSRPAIGSWVIVLIAMLAAWNRAHGRRETPESTPE